MLAEIFMLRIEFLARVTAETTKCSFGPTPTGGHLGLPNKSLALAITLRSQRRFKTDLPNGHFASSHVAGPANKSTV
jgi:hypothetical protein